LLIGNVARWLRQVIFRAMAFPRMISNNHRTNCTLLKPDSGLRRIACDLPLAGMVEWY
jgi:hypothetical protein